MKNYETQASRHVKEDVIFHNKCLTWHYHLKHLGPLLLSLVPRLAQLPELIREHVKFQPGQLGGGSRNKTKMVLLKVVSFIWQLS